MRSGCRSCSFPGLTGTAAFFFDSVTLTGFARVAYYFGLPNASLLYALAPLALGAVALAVRRAPHVVAGIAIVLALATGAGVYATDRLATSFSAQKFSPSPPDWLDRSNLGPATYLVLPQSDYFIGTSLESWNRDVRHVAVLQTQPPDPFPSTVARITRDGRLHLGAAGGRTVVVNVGGSSISLNGRVVARPLPGLVAYRLVPGTTRVKWLAKGLASDGWTGTTLRYQAWPIRPGRYDVTLAIPPGTEPRRVRIGDRTLTVTAGKPRRLTIPTDGRPLELKIEVPNAPLGGRVLGVKVLALRFARRLARRQPAQRVGLVGPLPREVAVVAAEVAVRGSLREDRPPQVEVARIAAGPEVEVLADERLDPLDRDRAPCRTSAPRSTPDARRRSHTRR